ncbi:MAG: UDP-N-acetylmuramoyl-L-alanyl-D-glutamate--2,6-diaminopimelate ligase [Gammaproteobacteria bacterium]|nr:UDP-N-acetylmuramoyl-L-alanyl-D-glutamate--2,6-diaminopimelate ligase [Gammaproteobacteria bacterium]
MMAAMKFEDQQMTLKQLLSDFVSINCLPDIPVTGLSLDSRQIKPGNIFVALEGQIEHGLAFAEAALNKGAVAVLCDRKFDQYCQQILSSLMTRIVCVPINKLEQHLGEIASRYYAHPSHNMFAVGVTGTDGKTSVSHFIAQALDDASERCAVLGTIGNGLIGQLEPASHTTPDVVRVHQLFSEYQQQGASQLVMEVSSHGLDQGRVDAVDFDVAVLTNLGRDHLDYHGDLDAYRNAKRRLFEQPQLKAIVLNIDDEFGRQLATELHKRIQVWTYRTQGDALPGIANQLSASVIGADESGLKIEIKSPFGAAPAHLSLLGEFNVSNALATLSVLLIRGIQFDEAIQRLEKLKTVSGRMESFHRQGKPLVVVDYAHTPQALASALFSLRKHCTGELYCVFGCGGDRDQGKRPLMAQAAEKYADKIFITDDNPRTENADDIVQAILSGFKKTTACNVVHDRKQAIADVISQAGEHDVVLVAGKGHEDYQIIGSQKYAFSDVAVVQEFLGVAE